MKASTMSDPKSSGVSAVDRDIELFYSNFLPFLAKPPVVAAPSIEKLCHDDSYVSTKIEKDATGEIVSELRIRLAGFGGVLPGSLFDDSLVKAVKQYERDVMGRTETGVVDGAFALSLDDFAKKWPIDLRKVLRCPCGKCGGHGKSQKFGVYIVDKRYPANSESLCQYEYPGIHRSVLWGARALMHYATVDHKDKIRFYGYSSGYRCHIDNKNHNRPTTNHMGKAVDLHFCRNYKGKWLRQGKDIASDVELMRTVAQKRMNATLGWEENSKRFGLETAAQGAKTWVHLDVREWGGKGSVYLADEYFVKYPEDLDGTSMFELLKNVKQDSVHVPTEQDLVDASKKMDQLSDQAQKLRIPQPASGMPSIP